uniref:Uncharacterized protein n=1 Tax=Panagrolaimus sp. PS1159 TaxID=55785 RepID=A0AC35GVU4_9BILA
MLNMVFNREKNIFKYFFGDTIFKIPSKPLEYNKELNAVGTDFGTLECCAAVIRQNGPEAVVLDPLTNKRTLPSYVSINEANQPCGQLFMNRMERNPEYSAYETKRLIGKEMEEIIVDPSWLFNVIRYRGQTNLLFHDKKNEPEMRSVIEITNYVLKQIKVKTEEFQGERLENVVITVPSNFSQEQKAATIVAANVVGWNSVHLLLEPISALIAYSHEAEIPNKSTVFVFDFGGGTKTCISKIVNN